MSWMREEEWEKELQLALRKYVKIEKDVLLREANGKESWTQLKEIDDYDSLIQKFKKKD